jgi:hypothetical protein
LRRSAAAAIAIAIALTIGGAVAAPGEERGIAKTVSRAALPGGLVLTVEPGSVAVERGALRAPLSIADRGAMPRALKGVDVDDAGHVIATITDSCDHDHAVDLTLADLGARLDDLAAEAAAAAQLKAGRPTDAVRTLAPLLAKAPIGTYARVASTPALAPLARRPELARLRSTPGRAKLTLGKDDVTMTPKAKATATIAASGQHHLLAAVESPSGPSACAGDANLLVFDAAGIEVARLPLYTTEEKTTDRERSCPFVRAARTKIAARVAAAQRFLTDLGFSPAGGEAGTIAPAPGDPQAQFPHAKLTLVLGPDRAWIRAGEDERGSAARPAGAQLAAATLLADPSVVVLRWTSGGEGCGARAGTSVIPVRAAP